MISIPLTEAQFDTLKAKLSSNSQILTQTATSNTTGSFSTSQVALDYTFTGSEIELTVTAKHGLARFANESTIGQHIQELINETV